MFFRQLDVSTKNFIHFQENVHKTFFSPFVTVNDSPSHIKSIKNDNIGIRQRMKSIAKTLTENHRKWEAAHRRGVTLCKAIDKCKLHAIQTFNNADTDPSNRTLYPTELKPICDKLQVITTIFEDVSNSANESKRQINSFLKLGAANVFAESPLVFRTWTCDKIQNVIHTICTGYKEEYRVKFNIMENIAHSRSDSELAWHVAVWEHQMYVNAEFELIFKALINEADIEMDEKT